MEESHRAWCLLCWLFAANGCAFQLSVDTGVLEQVLISSTTTHNVTNLSWALADSAQYKLDQTPTEQI